jgi:hypothetical protein
MKEELEDFIRQNKNEFDNREPAEKVWTSVERSILFSNKSWWNSVVLWRAAAIVFFAVSVYLAVPKTFLQFENNVALKEFTDVETFYVKQISEKVELIDGFSQSEGMNGFTQDFKQLEAMYLVLKEEMKSRPSQKVKDALVLNLLVQIDLLNQHLHKLENEDTAEPVEKPRVNT